MVAGNSRIDGRTSTQLRPLACEQGILNRADGSARFMQGDTSVLAAVYGPGQPKSAKKERLDRAVLEVLVKPHNRLSSTFTFCARCSLLCLTFSLPLEPWDSTCQQIVRGALEPLIVLSQHPRTVISVVLQVVGDHGSVLSALINASVLALMDAGINTPYNSTTTSGHFAAGGCDSSLVVSQHISPLHLRAAFTPQFIASRCTHARAGELCDMRSCG